MTKPKLSDRILVDNMDVFDKMLGHRFVLDIKNGTMSSTTFERYLRYEGAFVETAISIVAYAVANSKTMNQKRKLISVLDALANQQINYFERVYLGRKIEPDMIDVLIPPVVAFQANMLNIAREGNFLDIIVALFAAEWMYFTWCSDAANYPISDPWLKEWVALHADPAFTAQALWLKMELDEAGPALSEKECQHLSRIFARVTELEIDFHNAPYA